LNKSPRCHACLGKQISRVARLKGDFILEPIS